ncbi:MULTISPECIES: NAD-dependent epimerase/dehydratase family protein [Pseudomonas]|uniref:NAD-dependent epimerase/dehydratase family protein n=1 Tax=Pseudomonas juntendi TaxID=2666183 RepID=A0ABD4YDF6_9PSED|nr:MULTISPECIES: NAD-dependent epimerase/dehydratase family protein [Pseudomonas]MBH3372064.1 NAD-dependent epimerase/dehydratase family protein [Pseudomonas juntendi]MBS6038800.1 NAD-dependent epimerase/dehydratase family protein [Pseudomonas sp.]MDH0757384.1 NAD-dependent epimerase/dehydratase family protein [Pseudomonas juntendi]MDH1918326.1 NAD-dependent epimerase/dehydratase family protein [Pseudomonas juntendi]RRV64220.1 NAD-dependent epimerase/dehydratase family protein [Pseudomonas sp.
MRVMISGANGFVGRQLVERLLQQGQLRGQKIEAILAVDQTTDGLLDDSRLRRHEGSITNPALLRRVLADGIDVVFHLVSIPGGAAEANYDLGYQVNLQASLELLQQLRNRQRPPVLVYASSVAVYGGDLPARMDESQPAHPQLSYAAHKRMVEIGIEDLVRRGELDGRVVRLPGIVARPKQPNGLKSAFMSDLLHAYAAGEAYECPVSPQATCWWMSASCCVDNLIRAAELSESQGNRVWQLPVLQLSISEILEALASRFGAENSKNIRFNPDPQLEALFGSLPPLRTTRAREFGFRNDRSASQLIRNALGKYPPFTRLKSTEVGITTHELG